MDWKVVTSVDQISDCKECKHINLSGLSRFISDETLYLLPTNVESVILNGAEHLKNVDVLLGLPHLARVSLCNCSSLLPTPALFELVSKKDVDLWGLLTVT